MTDTPIEKEIVTCPRCNGASCERIPRSKIVKMLFKENMRHYKCTKCFKKFYKTMRIGA